MSTIDEAGELRPGEELDIKLIDDYLKSVLDGLSGQVEIRQFPSGASNLTYAVVYPDKSFILRRPPMGHKDKSAHDMAREYRIMSALKKEFPFVPEMIHFCEDESILGSPFYLMQRMEGTILRKDIPEELDLTKSDLKQLCFNFIDLLVSLHRVSVENVGLDVLGKGEGYVQRQIDGWARRLEKAATNDLPDFSAIVDWLRQHNPGEVGISLIHNDYRFDNVVLDPNDPLKIIGVLDWEMSTIGDPLMDLGNSLSYWVQADDHPVFQQLRMQPTHIPGMLSRSEVIEYYQQQSGIRVDNFDFYRVYGDFRLAVVLQQLYYRYSRGQTKDKRFAGLMPVICQFKQRCELFI